MDINSSPSNKLDIRVIVSAALRQFVWWLIVVLLVTLSGYSGIVCVTPMAWLLAMRAGVYTSRQSHSGLRSQRQIEAALAGALLGLLQGILFAIIMPLMGPIQANEVTNSILLVLFMLAIGILAGAGLSFFTAYLNENRRGNS